LSVPLRGEQWTNVGGMTGVQQPDGFAAALAHPAVQRSMEGKAPRKIIVVPNRIINVVV